ncbi:MAG: DMT family transporter [Clostridia bacterium]|nr:DMT family transporter [Clostridia bacterium]
MKKATALNLIGMALLLAATIVWGTSFFILKETIESAPTFFVIAVRFLIAGIGLSLIFIKKLLSTKKSALLRGIILGLLLTAAYMTQTIGLENTTPGRNAFLTSSYCVMCPFIIWALFRTRPKLYNVISAVLCIVGIGMVALSGAEVTEENVLLGDGLTLCSAVFFGLQIIFIDKYQTEGYDPVQLLIPELLTVGVIFIATSAIFELPNIGISGYALNSEQILNVLYLTFACTFFAQFAQILGQKFTTANQSAIILSLESVFGVMFSVIFGVEKLTTLIIIGFVIIFIAMMVSELHLDPVKLFKKKSAKLSAADENKNKEE